jgi:signal transduction histidine kinase
MTRHRAKSIAAGLLVVLALVLIHGMEQGLQANAALRAEVLRTQRTALSSALPSLAAVLRGGDAAAWRQGAALAQELGLATEVEVFAPDGSVLFAEPRRSPSAHWPDRFQMERLRREHVLTLGPVAGGRLVSYISFDQTPRPFMVKLSYVAPVIAEHLAEYRKLMLSHGLGLVAVAMLAALALAPGERPGPDRPGALGAYEEAMQQLEARGRSLSRQHQVERERLERAMEEGAAMARAGELTSGIVHEVRNGLATIVGHARLLEPAAEAREAAAAILQECATLETVVRRFLDFIRQETLDLAPFDLGRLLSRVVGREARQHPGCQVSMPAGEAGLLEADEDLLERAFENVVRNALEAAGAGGRVAIAVERRPGVTTVLIDDDGPGLDPAAGPRPRAFFSTKAGGTGLGLPIAEKIITLHGGELRLEPRQPRGVRARVELPQPGDAS